MATWTASSAVMTHLLHQLMALESILPDSQLLSQRPGFVAAALPAPWLQQHLKGTAENVSSAGIMDMLGGANACQAAFDKGLLLIQIAAGCLFERMSLQSVELGIFWLQHVCQWVSALP